MNGKWTRALREPILRFISLTSRPKVREMNRKEVAGFSDFWLLAYDL